MTWWEERPFLLITKRPFLSSYWKALSFSSLSFFFVIARHEVPKQPQVFILSFDTQMTL